MRKSHNEQGYALLIVLFLVVFIMAVSAVFIRGSIGNAKQEIKVDESHLTVMAAEAGVDYYKTYVSNLYFSIIPDLETFIQNDIKKQLDDPENKAKVIDYNLTRKNTTSELERIFKEEEKILELTLEKNIALYNFEVMTTSVKGYPERHTVIVEGVSLGMKNGNKKKISFQQSFIIPDLSGSSDSIVDEMASSPNMNNLYPDNVEASSCGSNKKLLNITCKGAKNGGYDSVENSTIYFPGGFDGPNGNLEVNYSKLYSNDDFEVHVFNNLNGSDLNINGSFEVKQNMNNIYNSSIKVNGALDINSNVQNMTNSMMIIRGAAHIGGHLNIKNSLVCVSGSSNVEGHLTVGRGSKLIYLDNFVVGGKKKVFGEMIQVNNENEFWEQCKLGNSNSAVWSNPIIEDVNYE
ncbi:hypothetical protein MHZ92_12710 [Sporosarcina sp. ACRSL]|uniref:hypothetical protein n=1 Tax=Sporosarcina sp. ACRSL TaxID=2918215 RepID=UPI001EF3F3A5|nr:hypothetical protein [Sporosarcina sp. ACRSL]MCG7345000.1 hypothetical protein [Sporosarcina sp. ACRSL]